jgi:hypothetical protein
LPRKYILGRYPRTDKSEKENHLSKFTDAEMAAISCEEAEPLLEEFRKAADGYRTSAIFLAIASLLAEVSIHSAKTMQGSPSAEIGVELASGLALKMIKMRLAADFESNALVNCEDLNDKPH